MDNSIKPYRGGLRDPSPARPARSTGAGTIPTPSSNAIDVRGNPLLVQRTDRRRDRVGPRGARSSLQHARRPRLVLGKAGLDQFTDACVTDPAIKAMRRKIEVAGDPAISTIAVEVDFFTSDGKKHSALDQGGARLARPNPLKDAEIEQKLLDEAKSWRPQHDMRPLIDAVWALDKSGDVSTLAA